MNHLPSIILPFLLPFRILFYVKKSFCKMILLFVGGVLCRGGRTVCGCLRTLGMHGESAFANYHHLLSRAKFDMLRGVKILMEMLLPLAGSSVVLVVDEHLERRRGEKIKAKAMYRDPVASSRSWLVKCTGLKWVVIAILITFPWSIRPFALPIFCVLRRPEDDPKNARRKHRSGTDLLCQMLMVIRRWFPHLPITLLGDGDYARVKLCTVCQKLAIGLVTRMRDDARLYDCKTDVRSKRRRAVLGARLSKPERNQWDKLFIRWYGGQIREVLVASKNCLWLGGKQSAIIAIKAIWIEMRPGDEMVLMTTNLDMSSLLVIENYVKRWNIEVTFRECREYLGIETQRQWSDLAIERSTPLLFMLYTLITLIGNAINNEGGLIAESTAWYKKTQLTFSDLLEAVRKKIGSPAEIVNSLLRDEFTNRSSCEDLSRDLGMAKDF